MTRNKRNKQTLGAASPQQDPAAPEQQDAEMNKEESEGQAAAAQHQDEDAAAAAAEAEPNDDGDSDGNSDGDAPRRGWRRFVWWLLILALLGGGAYLGLQWWRGQWTPPAWLALSATGGAPAAIENEQPPAAAPLGEQVPASPVEQKLPGTTSTPATPIRSAAPPAASAQQLRQLQQQLAQTEADNRDLRRQLLQTRQEQGELRRDMANIKLQVASTRLETQADGDALLAAINRMQRRHMLAQAHFLLAAAARPIHSPIDARSARQVLRSVDQMLRSLEDSAGLDLVRKALAEDMLRLRKLENLDINGGYWQLEAISKELEALPFIPRDTPSLPTQQQRSAQKEEQEGEQAEEPRGWQTLLDAFRDTVIIRRHHEALPPLPSMEQRALLLQQLRLQLEQAKFALLRGHREIYQKHLKNVAALLEAHFPPTLHATSKALLDDIRALDKQLQDVPQYPLYSNASLRAFEGWSRAAD